MSMKTNKVHTITIDDTTATGKLLLGVLDLVAELEVELIEQHRMDMIAAAQARGLMIGRKPKMNDESVIEAIELKEAGCTNNEVAKEFRVGRSTLLRYVAKYRAL